MHTYKSRVSSQSKAHFRTYAEQTQLPLLSNQIEELRGSSTHPGGLRLPV